MPENPEPEHSNVTRLLGKFWTVANGISLVRLLLVPPVTWLILTDGNVLLLWALLALTVVSDYFDGRVARWSDTVSEWGKVLDPVADKAAAIAVTLALVLRGSLPAWFVALVAGRDFLILLGGFWLARKRSVVVMSTWSGKIAVTAIAVTIMAALLKADPEVMLVCLWTTTVLLAISFASYATRYARLMRGTATAAQMKSVHSISSASSRVAARAD